MPPSQEKSKKMALSLPGIQRQTSGKRTAPMGPFFGGLQPNPKRLAFGQGLSSLNDNRAPGRPSVLSIPFGNSQVNIGLSSGGRIPPGETDAADLEDGQGVTVTVMDISGFEFGALSMLGQMTLVMPDLKRSMFGGDGPFRDIPILDLTDDRINMLTGDNKHDSYAAVRYTIAAANFILAHLRSDRVLPDASEIIRMTAAKFIGFSYLASVAGDHGKRPIGARTGTEAATVRTEGRYEHALVGANGVSADKVPYNGGKSSFIIEPLQTDVYIGLVLVDVPNGQVYTLDDSHHHSVTVERTDVHTRTWQFVVMHGSRIPTREDVSRKDMGYRTIARGAAVWQNARVRRGAYTRVGRVLALNTGRHHEIDVSTNAGAPPEQETLILYTSQKSWVAF